MDTYLTAAFPNCRDGVLQILDDYDYDYDYEGGRAIAAYGLLSAVSSGTLPPCGEPA